MNSRRFTLTLLAALALTTQVNAQQIIKFDAPNAGTGSGQGTYTTGINTVGVITGNVTDDNNATHGFVGTPMGGFANFDAPGANPVVGCTCPNAINDFGTVTGYDIDTNSVSHGFVRTPDGRFTTFDDSQAPAGTGASQGTVPQAINDGGEITGYYVDGSGATHGFVRAAGGKITTFDVVGASGGTYPSNINNFGVIAGFFFDVNYVGHGFVRTADGQITTFDPPNSFTGPSSYGTVNAFINDLGVIAGSYYDASTYVEYGYVRWPDGRFSEFAAPGAGTVVSNGDQSGTNVTAINLEGATTGNLLDDNFESHSFVRAVDGTATAFDVPGQVHVPDTDAGSIGVGINALGVIAGHWRDANFTFHGYVRTP